jgi:UDP-glucose 4-epimerase
VIPTFVKQALANRPITVFGDGKQSRCFCYVGDVVGALIKLMDNEKSVGQVFNIGSDTEISMFDLAKKVKELTSSESEIVLIPYDEAYEEGFEDMPRRVPNTSKAKKHIDFAPTVDLEGILTSVIAFHSGQQSQERRISAAEG